MQQGTVTANSRYIEVRYSTPKGYATPHFHPSEEEDLERKLISLKRRHIEATVINLLTGEVVGSVEEGVFDNGPGTRIGHWMWWYCPAGIDAKEATPAQARKIVSSRVNELDAKQKGTKDVRTVHSPYC
jgi:hypothetical protein